MYIVLYCNVQYIDIESRAGFGGEIIGLAIPHRSC